MQLFWTPEAIQDREEIYTLWISKCIATAREI